MGVLKVQKQKSITINYRRGWHIVILALFIFIPMQTIAQGVPKAYEAINYRGIVNGQTARFVLANGYIGASSMKLFIAGNKKPILFEPDQGVSDEKYRLKFIPNQIGRHDYFIMNNMQEAYDENPAYMEGNYYLDHQVSPVKFKLIKRSNAHD